MKTDTNTIVAALKILSHDIQSSDGIANACIEEASSRLKELSEQVENPKDQRDCAMKITKKKNKTTITLSRQYLEFIAVRLHNTAYNKSSSYTFSHTTISGTTTLEFIITEDK